jgi:hypothetical protein
LSVCLYFSSSADKSSAVDVEQILQSFAPTICNETQFFLLNVSVTTASINFYYIR